MDLVIRGVATTQEDHNYILAYADDIAQIAASEGELADIMNVWQVPSKVEPIEDRSHYDGSITPDPKHQYWIPYHEPSAIKYLGSKVNEQSTQEEEIKNRIAKYSQNVGRMYRLLKDGNVPKIAEQVSSYTYNTR